MTSPQAPVPGLPAVPALAASLFGPRQDLAERYAAVLADAGVVRGLLGPREVPRLWQRHLLNSAVVTDLLPVGAEVVDVGSGAGLPGLVLALRRSDLRVTLVEPMLRRTTFLAEVVHLLGLGDTVRVVRGRAEDPATRHELGRATWVVARAVAPLDRLAEWCLPLLVPGGRLLALKGAGAQAEIAQTGSAVRRMGAAHVELRELTVDGLDEPTRVVVVTRSTGRTQHGKPGGSGR